MIILFHRLRSTRYQRILLEFVLLIFLALIYLSKAFELNTVICWKLKLNYRLRKTQDSKKRMILCFVLCCCLTVTCSPTMFSDSLLPIHKSFILSKEPAIFYHMFWQKWGADNGKKEEYPVLILCVNFSYFYLRISCIYQVEFNLIHVLFVFIF